jgi:ABC-2 type transport system permease protein
MTAAMMIAQVTTRQVLGLKRLLGFGALSLLPAVVLFVSSGRQVGSGLRNNFLGVGLGLGYALVIPTIALIIAASALGDERRDQTLSFLVVRPISRFVVALAKLTAAFLAAFALTGPGALALAAVYGARSGDWAYVVPMVVATAIATAVYASIFLVLGFLTERSTLIGLAFVFIWENGIVFAVPALATTSPWRVGYSAFLGMAPPEAFNEIGEALGNVTPGAGGALVRALVFMVVSALVTTLILRRRDLA